MIPRDRVVAALRLEPVDRVPAVSLMTGVTTELMQLCGVHYPEAHHSAGPMVTLAAAAHEFCGLETIKLPFDMTVETELLGGKVNFGDECTLPQVAGHPFQALEDFRRPDQISGLGRVPLILEAIELAKNRYRSSASAPAIVSSIVGPFTLAGLLFGLETLLIATIEEPDLLLDTLLKVTGLCREYALLQAQAGSDVVQIGEATSSGDLISPDIYRDFIAPCHSRLCRNFPVPTVVHICGQIGGHMPYIAQTGMSGISFDAKTDIAATCRDYKGKLALVGAVEVLNVFSRGTPGDVTREAEFCLRSGIDLLCAGCAWPVSTPLDNIKALVAAARDFKPASH
jgi:[methyl-Co(III) methanol-specific corrinoid protein]:coenzyme M methyltransferase